MRAAWYEAQGEAGAVLQLGERERPEPAPGEVRVRIHASGVNPSDTYARAGRQGPMVFPWVIPHQDGAGVVDAVGPDVSTERIGERVWVYEATWNRPGGTAADYCVVPTARAVRLPAGVGFDVGACLGIPAMTAHRAVFADGSVEGQTVLVTGGAGAVGSTAIQLAVWGGATVVATVSSELKARAARESGARHVVNYREQDVVAEVSRLTAQAGVDRVVDVDFGGNLATTLQIVKPNGTVASYASRGDEKPAVPFRQLMVKNVTVHAVLVYTMVESAKAAAARDITRALEQGALRPMIAQRLPLAEIADAHRHVERVSSIGNTVLELD
ncbi:MAG: NADPH:quinone reductase [Chloroflexi bacterium]|nr:NADPH:quinone reductase [Chloroflexota bacterium]